MKIIKKETRNEGQICCYIIIQFTLERTIVFSLNRHSGLFVSLRAADLLRQDVQACLPD